MTRKASLLMLLVWIGFLYPASAQVKRWITSAQPLRASMEQWTVNDVVFVAKTGPQQPFDEAAFAVISKEDTTQKVPLFYNGGAEWILRFSASDMGTYSYRIESPLNFSGSKTGTFEVRANQKKNRHGGVGINATKPNRFSYEDGAPYFNLAFECDWLFALDYGRANLSKTNHLLDLIAQKGFNQVVMNVYSHDVSWKKDPLLASHPEHEYGGRQDIFPFLGSNEHPDYSALNPAFFQHLDSVIVQMNEREIVSHLMIYVWNKEVAWPDMDTPEDNRYFDYVVKRYQAFPNIIWDISKEALFYGRATEEYISERIRRLRALDSYKRLLSVHDFKFCTRHPEEVDFISSQNWTHTLYQHMLDAANKFKNKPILNIEHGGYEESPYEVFTGSYTDAEVCLRRNYMCLFAGVYTTYYWQGTSWNVIIHNPYQQGVGFYKPKWEYFAYLHDFFTRFPFEKFKPHPWQNASGYNLTNEEDGTLLMYIPKENHSVQLYFMAKEIGDGATTQFFNTLTGEYTPEREFELNSAGVSPWSKQADTILIVRKKK